MADKEVKSDGNLSLADFQINTRQTEAIVGPLVSLRSGAGFNVMGYDLGESPANEVTLETFEGSDPPDKAGHTLVCKGDCLVDGNAAKVAAYRKQ